MSESSIQNLSQPFLRWMAVSAGCHLFALLLLWTVTPTRSPAASSLEVSWVALAPPLEPAPELAGEPLADPGQTALGEPQEEPPALAAVERVPESSRPVPAPNDLESSSCLTTEPIDVPSEAFEPAIDTIGDRIAASLEKPLLVAELFPRGHARCPRCESGLAHEAGFHQHGHRTLSRCLRCERGPARPEGEGWNGRMGYGLVPVPVVEERLQEDGKDAIARERVARALVSPEVYGISEEMELAWEVEPGDVRRWPVRPETRVEYFAPPGAEEEIPGTTCTYRRFSLASVQVVIDRDGALVSKKVVQSSGSRRLDREVMDLVTRSAPFPPPNPRDLNASGVNETLWDVGVRDYRISSCIYIKGPRLVKDIVLERVN